MSTTDRDATTWLSQDAHDRLQAELEELIANRPVIAAEINARREEGDLRENGGYHAAREEQGKTEGRIRYLQELLRTAQVGEAPEADWSRPAPSSPSTSTTTPTTPRRSCSARGRSRPPRSSPSTAPSRARQGDPRQPAGADRDLHRAQRGRDQGHRRSFEPSRPFAGQLRRAVSSGDRGPPGITVPASSAPAGAAASCTSRSECSAPRVSTDSVDLDLAQAQARVVAPVHTSSTLAPCCADQREQPRPTGRAGPRSAP